MTTDPLVAALKAALPDAMRARDTEAVSAIRTALAAVANAEAVGSGAAATRRRPRPRVRSTSPVRRSGSVRPRRIGGS